MSLNKITIDCQNPPNRKFIRRAHTIVEGKIEKGTANYNDILQRAEALAAAVNPGAANQSGVARDRERIMQGALAGITAEQSWMAFINHVFGAETAAATVFEQANGQIDIRLFSEDSDFDRRRFVKRDGRAEYPDLQRGTLDFKRAEKSKNGSGHGTGSLFD